MIRKLKRKYVTLSMVSLLILLVVVVIGMNTVNYISFVQESDELLSLLSHNKGKFPDFEQGRGPDRFSPETPHESRYFTVLLTDGGSVTQIDTGKISSVDSEKAAEYAELVFKSGSASGFVERFRFSKTDEPMGVRITFLDCGRKLDSLKSFAYSSVGMAAIGYLVVFVVMIFAVGKIVKPVVEAFEKQKRFITDAGHEIKTPLTIINANADLLEMELQQNENVTEIKEQTKRLSELTNSLTFLAKIEESDKAISKIEFPISDAVGEQVASFLVLAQVQNKQLVCDIEPMMSFTGNDKAIRQLVSVLIDNALKYSPENSEIRVQLKKQNKSLFLAVSNVTLTEIDSKEADLLFERFYRVDKSRNSDLGGHGIGLSIAKAIAEAHSGKIKATVQNKNSLCISVWLPM